MQDSDASGSAASLLAFEPPGGEHWVERIRRASGPPDAVLPELVLLYVAGWRWGPLAPLHRPTGGDPAEAERLLGETLGGFAELLRRWHLEERLVAHDPEAEALRLIGPVQLLLTMRLSLGADGMLPGLDVEAFARDHAWDFAAARMP
jgi:hypothetical protein